MRRMQAEEIHLMHYTWAELRRRFFETLTRTTVAALVEDRK